MKQPLREETKRRSPKPVRFPSQSFSFSLFVDDAESGVGFGLKAARFADGARVGCDGLIVLGGRTQDAPLDR